MSYEPKTYRKDGGDTFIIASGGEMDVESGGAFKIDGTQVTASAAELNKLDLSAVGAQVKVEEIDITAPADDSEISSGFTLPDGAVVFDVFLHVLTKEDTGSTKELDIGTDSNDSGDPNGYADGLSVANTGIVRPSLAHNAVTRGALLYENTADGSAPVPIPDTTMGGKEITYTAGASDFDELVAKLYIVYMELDYSAG